MPFVSPDGKSLTIVLLNTDSAAHGLTLDLGGFSYGTGKLALREMAGDPFVTIPRQIAPRLYDIVAQLAAQAGISLNIAQEAIQMQTVVSLVSSGLGGGSWTCAQSVARCEPRR